MTKLWGGRFSKETNPLVEKFTQSIHYDYKIALYDVIGSMLHVKVLEQGRYLERDEASKLFSGLEKIFKVIEDKKFVPDETCEDVHTQIQKMLESEVGDLVLKLQMARSRNDQVVFSTKLYCKDEMGVILKRIGDLTTKI